VSLVPPLPPVRLCSVFFNFTVTIYSLARILPSMQKQDFVEIFFTLQRRMLSYIAKS
jgi:hypothetical protein